MTTEYVSSRQPSSLEGRFNSKWTKSSKRLRRTRRRRISFPLLLSLLLVATVTFPAASAQITENFDCSEDGCCDHHEFCRFWESFGECDNNRGWMMSNCQITCNGCGFDMSGISKGPPQPQRPQGLQIDQLTSQQPPQRQQQQPQFQQQRDQQPQPQQQQQQQQQQQKQQSQPQQPQQQPQQQQQQQQSQPQQKQPQAQQQQQQQGEQPQQQQPQRQVSQQGQQRDQKPQQQQQQQQRPSFQASGPRQQFQGNNAARCERIRQSNVNNTIEQMIQEGLLAEREDASFRQTISLDDIMQSNRIFACAPQQSAGDCSRNICFNLRYRTMDGTCNNFRNPLQGAAATPFMRLRPANYDDGLGAPTASIRGGRPSVRETTKFILRSQEIVNNNRFNALLMQFGQFVTHDITKTSVLPHDQCPPCQDMGGRCLPIRVGANDGHSACQQQQQQFGQCCLQFARASPICGTGQNNVRLQLNENTAFLDGSMIYGSSIGDNFRLRDGPFMRMVQFNGRHFLPFDQEQCFDPFTCKADFKAGDDRVTIFVGLTAFHTIMLREHNRIASVLQGQNRHWNMDRVFQEARKIVGAELQAITYKEWLPKILGRAFDNIIGKYNGYNVDTNPSIASEFTHGAMRFGHGMIPEFFSRLDANGQSIAQGGMRFDEGILKPQRLLFEGGIDPLIRGMMTMPVKKPQRIANIVTERMFGNNDLASINLQRGRDAGVPSYNEMREFCGMKKAPSFDEVSAEILDANVRANLRKGFGTPENVDLYVGALMEDPIADGMVGATLSCLIGDQFKRIRDGDRFWYQNPATFTPNQLAELERATLARLICDNADNIHMVPADAFQVTNDGNLVSCNNIPGIDLRHWSE